AAVSLRGGNAGVLLLSYADAADSVDRWLAVRLALETVGWFAVILVAVAVSAVVMSWCNQRLEGSPANPGSTRDIAAATMAGYDAPGIGPRFFQSTWDTSTPLTEGLKHTGIAAAVGLLGIAVLSAGLSTRGIQHGQACFMVGAAIWIASYVAFRAIPVRSAFWPMLAVPIVAIAGYAWAVIQPSAGQTPPNLPASHFLRVLPIQYISVGTVAALVMFWSRVIPASCADGNEGAGKPSRRGAG
ncbi:MAG: hypothetical protein KJ749_09325, partial [Planctomycetes bacterium]|nr:hypothetical protein [Planctomycetota bacterium]